MKKNEWLEKVSLVDEKFIEEADPAVVQLVKPRRSRIVISLVAAIAMLLVMTLTVTLIVPLFRPEKSPQGSSTLPSMPSSTEIQPSSYEELYQVLLNAGAYWGGAEGDIDVDIEPTPDADPNEPTVGDQYQETTDNQISGVIEPDLLKRSDRYLYYLERYQNRLCIYSIEKENSKEVGSYSFDAEQERTRQIFLSKDCKTVTVICNSITDKSEGKTTLFSLDVSDPTDITLKNKVAFSGAYLSARMVGDQILLISSHRVNPSSLTDVEDHTYLPYVVHYDGETAKYENYDISEIIYPKEAENCQYVTLALIHESDLSVKSKRALLSYTTEPHINGENIYFMRQYTVKQESADEKTSGVLNLLDNEKDQDGGYIRKNYTDIVGICYSDEALPYLGKVTLEGSVKDRYCIDEYGGILRVAATIDNRRWVSADRIMERTISAVLYCVDLKNFTIAATVKDFAPQGESVHSARFEGTTGYVCTAIQSTDPVFFFDLSEISNITYTQTAVIEGYSSNLTEFGEGYLLGIGYNAEWNLKVEMYKEENGKVISVDSYVPEGEVSFSSVYNDYFIDRENGLIGIAVNQWQGRWSDVVVDGESGSVYEVKNQYYYLLLHFAEEQFTPIIIAFETKNGTVTHTSRAVYIDGYLYLMADEQFIVQKLEI